MAIFTGHYLKEEITRVEKYITKVNAGINRTLLLDLILSGGNVVRAESEYFQWKIEMTEDLEEWMYAGVMEGAEYGKSGADPRRTLLTNNCQIFKQVAEISATAMALQGSVEGINNELAKRVDEKLILAKRALCKAILEGSIQNEDASQGKPRRMNGLLNIIQNTIDLENKGINTKTFSDAMKLLDLQGNGGDRLCFVNGDMKEAIDKVFVENTQNHVEIHAGQNTFGALANTIITNYGTVHVVLDHNMPEGQMMIFDPAEVYLKVLRPFTISDVQLDADAHKRVIIGEYSVMMKNPYSAVKIINADVK